MLHNNVLSCQCQLGSGRNSRPNPWNRRSTQMSELDELIKALDETVITAVLAVDLIPNEKVRLTKLLELTQTSKLVARVTGNKTINWDEVIAMYQAKLGELK